MSKRKKSSIKRASRARSETSVPSEPPLGALAGVALIVVVAFLAYLPSLNGGFIWDDVSLITENKIIKAANGLYRLWCTTESADYWPATYTTFWIEWRLWGINSAGYHVTNLILHIVEALLIWLILRKLSIPGAFLAAMIFAVHPVNVESVAWIAQRKNTMAMLFFLLSMLCYLNTEIRSNVYYWYAFSLVSFLLAMLSKGSVAVLPVLIMGMVRWLRPLTKWDLLRTGPFFLVAAVLAGVNVWFQTHGTDVVIRHAGFAERFLGAGGVVWFYLYKALLPIDLAFIYPQWRIQPGNPLWWLPLGAVLIVSAVLWRYKEIWSRPLLFAWGFFCVALLPVTGLTDIYFMRYSLVADHYQHIALVGVIALVTAGFSTWHQRARGVAHRAATVFAVLAVGTLAFLTCRQNGLYHDEITLYQATLQKNPASWLAHNNLGNALFNTSRPYEALEHYRHALALKPDYPETYNNMGLALVQTGRPQEAVNYYEQSLKFNSDNPEAHNNLGIALLQTDRPREAIVHFRQALVLRSDYAIACNNLALAYAAMDQSSEAISTSRKALELARSKGQTALAKEIEDWLNSYRAEK